ncbi:MAG: biopolymer transporter ExbD [Candidatus Aminicenantes bacterium]
MGVSVGKRDASKDAEPNVVPLCDVLLVLLIIFMVVTPMVQKGVDVQLPTASHRVDMPENPDVVLYIKEDGTLYVNEELVEEDTLLIMLEDAMMAASDKKLYLKADQDLEYGAIVELIEIMKGAGVEDIGLIAEQKAERID